MNEKKRLSAADRALALQELVDKLREKVSDDKFVLIGKGAEVHFNASQERFRAAYTILREHESHQTHYLRLGDIGEEKTTKVVKILAGPKTTYREIWDARDRIKQMWDDQERLTKEGDK